MMTEDQIYDLIEALMSEGPTSPRLADAVALALELPDEEALSVDPFQGDFEETSVFSDKMVRARKPYVDHWTLMPIEVGERHRCLCERTENGIITTRHSMLSLWVMYHGDDPSGLAALPTTKEEGR